MSFYFHQNTITKEVSTMFCYKCGYEMPDDAVFCSQCGTSQRQNSTSITTEINSEYSKEALRIYFRNLLNLECIKNKLEKDQAIVKNNIEIKNSNLYKRYFIYTDLNNSSKYLHLLYDGEEIKFAACNKSFGEGMKVDLSESLAAYYMAPEPKWLSVDSSIEIFENIWKYKLKYLFGTVTKTNKKIRDTCLMALDDFKSSTQMHKNILIEVKQLKVQLNGITAELNKASELLQQAYDVNIVPSQFRNLYAIYYLADFINTSNESLSNALLNYNLEKIKEKLDRIIEQQEEIIINQALMTVQNENIMKQNEQQLRHLASIEQNSDRAAQYAQIAANNAEACAWIGVANYISK